jgi:hypothetical protein
MISLMSRKRHKFDVSDSRLVLDPNPCYVITVS